VNKVGNTRPGDRPGEADEEISRLRSDLDLLRSELWAAFATLSGQVRTRSLLVVDDAGREVASLGSSGGIATLTVGSGEARFVVEAGASTVGIDLLAGSADTAVAVHLRAEVPDRVALVALGAGGDVVGEWHVLGDGPEGVRVETVSPTTA
jgi:hypothetical protein